MTADTLRPALRRARPKDAEAIARLLRESFGGDEEVRLLRALEADDDVVVSIVAEFGALLAAVINFARVEIRRPEGVVMAAAIAPLAVAPALRGRGVGTSMVRVGLAQARRRGAQAALARGCGDYFERFGFSAFMVERVDTAWGGDGFFGVALDDGVDRLVGDAYYPRAFFDEGAAASA